MSDIGEKNYLMSGVAQESTSQNILEAVGGVAQQEDVTEILSQIQNGVNVEFKVPISSQGFYGRSTEGTTTVASIAGEGYAWLNFNFGATGRSAYGYVKIDGNTLTIDPDDIIGTEYKGLWVRFKESLVVTVKGTSTSYDVKCYGTAFLEG